MQFSYVNIMYNYIIFIVLSIAIYLGGYNYYYNDS